MTVITHSSYPVDDRVLPHICWQSHAAIATASDTLSGRDAVWVQNGEESSRWAGTDASSVTLTLDYDTTAQTVDYVGLGALTLTDVDTVSIQTQATDGGAWTTILQTTETDRDTLLFLLPSADVYGVRALFEGVDPTPYVGIMMAGESLVFPRPCNYLGVPLSESRQMTYTTQRALQGAVLSRTVQGSFLSSTMTVNNLSEAWRRGDDWQGFTAYVEEDETGGFFIAPKPEDYPDDMAFSVVTDRPRFERARANANISGTVTVEFTGYRAP